MGKKKDNKSLKLNVPCSIDFSKTIRRDILDTAKRADFSEEEVANLEYAVGEVASNSTKYCRKDSRVDIKCDYTDNKIEVTITNEQKDLEEEILDQDDHGTGAGWFLASRLVDEVCVNIKHKKDKIIVKVKLIILKEKKK